jgi:hypothetical protein
MDMVEYTTPGGATNANAKDPQPSQSILQRWLRRPVIYASSSPRVRCTHVLSAVFVDSATKEPLELGHTEYPSNVAMSSDSWHAIHCS